MFLSNQWVKEKIKREIKNICGDKVNENTTYQDLLDAAKAVLRETCIEINAYIRKKRSQINNLILYLKELEERNKELSPEFTEEKQ